MHVEARIEPLNGKLPKVTYRWDPETDILTVACKGVPKGNGMNGTVDLEGGDGSFVVIDVAGGPPRGPGLEAWPAHVRTVPSLLPPEGAKDGHAVFPHPPYPPHLPPAEGSTAPT